MELPYFPPDQVHHLTVSRASCFQKTRVSSSPIRERPGPVFLVLTIPLVLIRLGSYLPSQVILVSYLGFSVLYSLTPTDFLATDEK